MRLAWVQQIGFAVIVGILSQLLIGSHGNHLVLNQASESKFSCLFNLFFPEGLTLRIIRLNLDSHSVC